MGWLVGQVWILCVIAFLAGSAVTWVAFVRPSRRAAPVVPPTAPATVDVERPAPASSPEPPAQPAPPAQAPIPGSALASMDTGPQPRVRPGSAASDALDELGVGRARPEAD